MKCNSERFVLFIFSSFFSFFLTTGRHPAPAADLVARRIRAKARRRKKSAATALRRVKTAAGVAAPKAKRARRKGRRARRIPGLGLGLAPGLVPDQELRIVLESLSQSSPRVMTREASPRGALAPVLAPLLNPNPEPGLNQSPNPSPVPPHLLKPAPTHALPHVHCPDPSPVPSLVLAPVPAPSSDFGLYVITLSQCLPLSSSYIPQTPQHYPVSCF